MVESNMDGLNEVTIDVASSSGMLQVLDKFLKRQSEGKNGGREGRRNTREIEDSDTEKECHKKNEPVRNVKERGRQSEKRENTAGDDKEETEDRQEKDEEESGEKGEGKIEKDKTPPLPLLTKTLVLEDVCFLDQQFLPKLVERMPQLQQISLQVRLEFINC